MIAESHGCRLFAARVHDGDHVHLFVSAKPKISIPELVGVLKCNSAKALLEEFSTISLQL